MGRVGSKEDSSHHRKGGEGGTPGLASQLFINGIIGASGFGMWWCQVVENSETHTFPGCYVLSN